jgi:RNA polymerase sigma-70 factor (ECF subfamily)
MEQEILAHIDGKRYRTAFELMMAQYQNKVFRLACSMLRDQALAEETAQDIFVRVWRALPEYRGLASVSTWIYSIARNTCLTALKFRAAHPTLSLDEPGVRGAAEARIASPREGLGADLPHLISQLPDKYRQVITLFYMEERSYDEVARLLDLPIGSVKTYLHRAKKELAASISHSKITGRGR